ncbi:hypothetical protein HS088_TW02G00630 [Tripterygium wilfordii]|uniref:Uncharacterized protein n=1 Tax=Tripterygium wilfordii TaxID=458696 RepID=A0A7J7DZ11_TRIWF|nr:uncharacterized protein LOC119981791 [Tripterygium wilfordii]XP_038680866.1 uncharacterized protein LOC119981791 [Tripterygium wilfordii]XP_038680872.1 uncharacterized protein LOC119981791 [Tripterygium wilfordii]XP_038680877.1 uncharacterized protein LOC119981791 [Tripterygium wilfordii]XP_038680884.1 uncharacterized protein LOC119981791 [Tripterygium wilfordii]XP_038680890.1 uncharacterized protein LOC119981791 [Tripterygium wilfordii]XP_038680895.1 uncharacterized protein LOC119981791 [
MSLQSITTMVVVQASKLSFTNPSLSSTTSLQFDAHSLSLALIHSDSSISLYPSLSPLSLTSFPSPSPQTLIPPPSSSSSFLSLQSSNPNTTPRVLFIVAGPHRGGSQILLRFYIVHESKNLFSRAQVVCTQKGVSFEPRLGVLLDLNHGLSVKLAGGINYFALCLNSSSKVLVFGVKMVGGDEIGVKLMRCAVIECCTHVWSMSVSFGFLILGEDNGVRVFNLRALAKGKAKKVKCSISNVSENHCLNGRHDDGRGSPNGSSEVPCNDLSDGKINKLSAAKQQLEQKSIGFPQNSIEVGECFVTFTRKEEGNLQSMRASVKAVSVQALSSKKFIILDSTGDLHVLCLASHALGSNLNYHMRQLPHVVKVQKLAILPDISSRTPIIWVSDLYHSVHVLGVSDMGPAVHKNDASKCKDKLMQISVIQAIFAGEKIQDVVPLAANGILLLGQDNLYVYAIS